MTKSRLASTLASTSSGEKGMTAQAARAGAMESMGASRKRALSAPEGMTISFMRSFTASMMGWSSPLGPTRLGPMRTCM